MLSIFFQQVRLLVFILHILFLDKEPILLSAKAKGRAPVNCFMEICIMLNDWGAILSWFFFFPDMACWATREKNKNGEKRTIKRRNWAFMLGHFDCITDWFQVRQPWKRGEIQGKRETLNYGWHWQDLSIKGRFRTAGVENRRGSDILYCGGWQLPAVCQRGKCLIFKSKTNFHKASDGK